MAIAVTGNFQTTKPPVTETLPRTSLLKPRDSDTFQASRLLVVAAMFFSNHIPITRVKM